MKTQKELKQLLAKQVEEISLSQQVELAETNNNEAVRILRNIASSIRELRDFAIKSENKNLEALAKKLDKALAK